jgi:hypothetical protein
VMLCREGLIMNAREDQEIYKLMKGMVEGLLENSIIFASEGFQNYWFGACWECWGTLIAHDPPYLAEI